MGRVVNAPLMRIPAEYFAFPSLHVSATAESPATLPSEVSIRAPKETAAFVVVHFTLGTSNLSAY